MKPSLHVTKTESVVDPVCDVMSLLATVSVGQDIAVYSITRTIHTTDELYTQANTTHVRGDIYILPSHVI